MRIISEDLLEVVDRVEARLFDWDSGWPTHVYIVLY